jgi:hypothetical protein
MTEAQRLLNALQATPDAERYQELDLHLSQLFYHLSMQLPYCNLEEDFPSEDLFLQLDLVRDEARLVAMLEEPERLEHAAAAQEALTRVEAMLDRLKAWEEQQPRFAELAWVNELCRVAVACQQEQLPAEALWERLAGARELYQELWMAIAALRPPFWEQARGQQLQADFAQALQLLQQGLDQVDQFGAEGDAELLDLGLEHLAQGAAQIQATYRQLQEAEAEYEKGLPCPKCEHLNPPGSRRCDACGATLPQAHMPESRDLQEAGWPDLVADFVAALQALDQPQSLQRLDDLVRRFGKGLDYFEKLPRRPELETLQNEVVVTTGQCLVQMESLRAPLEEALWDQVEALQSQFLSALTELLQLQDQLQNAIARASEGDPESQPEG